MLEDLLTVAADLRRRGEPFALATVVRCERPTSAKPGAKALIRPDGRVTGWVGGACAEPVVAREALAALRVLPADAVAMALRGLALGPTSSVVVATHGDDDETALTAVLASAAGYVSLVASRKRAATIVETLRHRGVPAEQLARLKAPAGLDIGAVTPEEIAVSILAEIIQARRHLAAAS